MLEKDDSLTPLWQTEGLMGYRDVVRELMEIFMYQIVVVVHEKLQIVWMENGIMEGDSKDSDANVVENV